MTAAAFAGYDGRIFASEAAETAAGGETPRGHYHQDGELVWAEFTGGAVRVGRLAGRCAPDGTLTAAYAQVLADGEIVSGEVTTVPFPLPDGRLRLREQWRRSNGSSGESWIEEVPYRPKG